MCSDNSWRYFMSHSSVETEDDFLADFAVAMGGEDLKQVQHIVVNVLLNTIAY